MESQKQKQKTNHVVIVTSDAADASVKQFRIKSWMIWLVVVIICILIGAGLGYVVYEEQIWDAANEKMNEYKETVKDLEDQLAAQEEQAAADKTAYEKEITQLNDKLTIMSDTINQKVEEVNALTEQMNVQYNPTLLPLTGGATIEEISEGDPMCLFNAEEGALVVATASGTVTEIVEEPEYGYKVSIDHGNGYVTIYRNQDEPKVKQGETVMRGVTIFIIDVDNLKLGYQITRDGAYINPMEMMEIEG